MTDRSTDSSTRSPLPLPPTWEEIAAAVSAVDKVKALVEKVANDGRWGMLAEKHVRSLRQSMKVLSRVRASTAPVAAGDEGTARTFEIVEGNAPWSADNVLDHAAALMCARAFELPFSTPGARLWENLSKALKELRVAALRSAPPTAGAAPELFERVIARLTHGHLEVDDGYYSCPRAENYFGPNEATDPRPCYCNAESDAKLAAELRSLVAPAGEDK